MEHTRRAGAGRTRGRTPSARQADTSLRSYRAEAHGFTPGAVGSGLTGLPRLEGDELRVEVYWRAPGISKQTILGWRDGTWLPTDINYHRDHLGVVTNNFGNRIRIGEGDEVRDVLHPLSPQGLDAYDFALQDSLAITANTRTVQVYGGGPAQGVHPAAGDRHLYSTSPPPSGPVPVQLLPQPISMRSSRTSASC
jgi:hypothetical protein